MADGLCWQEELENQHLGELVLEATSEKCACTSSFAQLFAEPYQGSLWSQTDG